MQLHSHAYRLSHGVNSTWAQEMIGCIVSGHASTCAIEANYDDSSASLPKITKTDLG